jgi:Spy/CpxP family protein refolding chaperone
MDLFTKNRFTGWVIVILVCLNVATLATLWWVLYHQPIPQRPPEQRPEDVQRFLEKELSLTPEQAERFRESRRRHAERSQAVRDQVLELRKDMIMAILADTPDTALAGQLADRIGALQMETDRLLVSHFMELQSICRPEQRERLRYLMHDLLEMMKPEGEGRPPGPDRPEGQRPPGGPPPGVRPSGGQQPGERPPRPAGS